MAKEYNIANANIKGMLNAIPAILSSCGKMGSGR
jgi:hypothetical protein